MFSTNNTQNGLFSKGFAVILFINTESLTHAYCEKTRIKGVNRARVASREAIAKWRGLDTDKPEVELGTCHSLTVKTGTMTDVQFSQLITSAKANSPAPALVFIYMYIIKPTKL